ncbi:MAG: hypothetical protein U1D41_05360 [Nitrosomonas sp.]|uniref:hypothetical protein n=1 Tax=Nitrosomonas sp. TaxID=42353 RepID=UPI002733FBA0|nr:hypothetical protein [Nitrosomonas sp.]MDP3282107.1 hypothetical protein [Nitrosomonas sp.]MDP3663213.1 hypothetical protein [Nitrosomonas sp.]MDZ4105585.1 hypothetical protein [Nitrosomonas sp.]
MRGQRRLTIIWSHRLKAKVNESLAASGTANADGLQRELQEKEAQYRADGIDPATVPKVQEIKQKLAQYSTGTSEHENAVFSHLLTFFSRYYDKGDFISQRRYKRRHLCHSLCRGRSGAALGEQGSVLYQEQ